MNTDAPKECKKLEMLPKEINKDEQCAKQTNKTHTQQESKKDRIDKRCPLAESLVTSLDYRLGWDHHAEIHWKPMSQLKVAYEAEYRHNAYHCERHSNQNAQTCACAGKSAPSTDDACTCSTCTALVA